MALSPAQSEKLSQLSKEQLLEFIDMLQKNWWNLQNNYILYPFQDNFKIKKLPKLSLKPVNFKEWLRRTFGLMLNLQRFLSQGSF